MDCRFRYSLLIAGALVASPAAAQAPVELPPDVTPDMVAQGKRLFTGAGLCLACHGPLGKGGIGPDLTDTLWLHPQVLDFEELVKAITTGFSLEVSQSGQLMPPRGGSNLKDAEVRAVAAYVWTLSRGGPGR